MGVFFVNGLYFIYNSFETSILWPMGHTRTQHVEQVGYKRNKVLQGGVRQLHDATTNNFGHHFVVIQCNFLEV